MNREVYRSVRHWFYSVWASLPDCSIVANADRRVDAAKRRALKNAPGSEPGAKLGKG